MTLRKRCSVSLIFLVLTLCLAEDPIYEKDVTLSAKEHSILQQFKKIVGQHIPETSLVKKWATDDLYLIRWLRARNMDINAAEKAFKDHLKWRDVQKMDTIDKEDWSDMADFPVFTDGTDKDGQPVNEMYFSEWPIRRAALSGQIRRVSRWMAHTFEMPVRRIYDGRANGSEIGVATALVSTEGFSIIEQACAQCVAVSLAAVDFLENQYPGVFGRIWLINNPPTFDTILRLIKPIMTPRNRNALRSFVRKEQWMPALDELIPKEERGTRMGGTKERNTI